MNHAKDNTMDLFKLFFKYEMAERALFEYFGANARYSDYELFLEPTARWWADNGDLYYELVEDRGPNGLITMNSFNYGDSYDKVFEGEDFFLFLCQTNLAAMPKIGMMMAKENEISSDELEEEFCV